MIADFQVAIEEAEQLRETSVFGLDEMSRALENTERNLGVKRDDQDLTHTQAAELQAAWERADMAKTLLANEYPHLHAMALIGMHSALDALVEELAPAHLEMLTDLRVQSAWQRLEEQAPDVLKDAPEEDKAAARERLRGDIAAQAPKVERLYGKGVERYERVLASVGLPPPPDQQVPDDLKQALAEIGALRDVIIHRAGRIDARALEAAPTLTYAEHEFVQIKRTEYRTYSAALTCYGQAVIDRVTRPILQPDEWVDLREWRGWYRINA